jgi:hypothetical protein
MHVTLLVWKCSNVFSSEHWERCGWVIMRMDVREIICKDMVEERHLYFCVLWICSHYIYIYFFLINFMVPSPSCEADSCRAIQEIFHLLWNVNFHYHFHNSPSLVPVMSRWNADQSLHPVCLMYPHLCPGALKKSLPFQDVSCIKVVKIFLSVCIWIVYRHFIFLLYSVPSFV